MAYEENRLIRRSHVGPAPKAGLMVKLAAAPRYAGILITAFPSPTRWFGLRSGTTLAAAARVLRSAGAGRVIGLVATKTARGES